MAVTTPPALGSDRKLRPSAFAAGSLPSANGRLDKLERIQPYRFAAPHDAAPSGLVTPWCLSPMRRVLDLLTATLLLLLCTPILLVAAILIKLNSPGPVFYCQWRTGYAGRRFRMYKLRTMVQNADRMKEKLRALSHHAPNSPDFKVRNDPRITRVGRVLRKLSLDELPNFINVIRGEMSLVGPRPTSFDIDVYDDRHLARLAVPQGITGLWQISGRSEIDFDDRVKLDCRYIRDQSFLLDLWILLLTPLRVLGARGAY